MMTFRPFRSLYRGEFFEAALQVLHLFHGLRRDTPGSALAGSPSGVAITRRRDSLHATDQSVAPPTGLLTRRFDARRFPRTPAVCYRAPWRLPGPDFHRLVIISLRKRIYARPLWAHNEFDNVAT
jgi:hypothetical protein